MKKYFIAVLFVCFIFTGLAQAESTIPGTQEGAKQLLEQFTKSGADYVALTNSLRPAKADYEAVFEAKAAEQAYQGYTIPWNKGYIIIKPKPGQSAILLWSATTEELKAGTSNASQFPGGYAKIKDNFKPGITLYRFKFVEPGQTLGMAYDGLAFVNNHWVVFPKPWRVIK
jgi:hypothetical protein